MIARVLFAFTLLSSLVPPIDAAPLGTCGMWGPDVYSRQDFLCEGDEGTCVYWTSRSDCVTVWELFCEATDHPACVLA